MNLEEEILRENSRRISAEIDRQILWDLLADEGWTRVDLIRFKDNTQAIDIIYWIENWCKSRWQRHGAQYIFEDPIEAELFILKWIS